jgi:hypothetical protein
MGRSGQVREDGAGSRMAAQGTTDEPHDAPHGDDEISGDGPEIFGDLDLAHEVSSTRRGSGFDVEFALFPLGIPRPTTGWTRTIVTCGHCGHQMWCTVYSISALHRARRRFLRIGVGSVSVLAVCWLGLLLALVRHVKGDGVLAFCTAVLVASLISWPALSWVFHQHRHKQPAHIRKGYSMHSLRRPGSTSEYRPEPSEPAI